MTDDQIDQIIKQVSSEVAGGDEVITIEQAVSIIIATADRLNIDPLRLAKTFNKVWERNHAD